MLSVRDIEKLVKDLKKIKKNNFFVYIFYDNNNFYILCCVIVGGILDHNIYELGFAEIKLKR